VKGINSSKFEKAKSEPIAWYRGRLKVKMLGVKEGDGGEVLKIKQKQKTKKNKIKQKTEYRKRASWE